MALQGRNPKEALGNFLASIGDIQRQHEVYAMENQRELDRQALQKSQLETEALNRTLAQSGEGRAVKKFGWDEQRQPFEQQTAEKQPLAVQGQIDESAAGTAAKKYALEDLQKQNAPGGRREVEQKLADDLTRASINHQQNASAASAAQLAEARAALNTYKEREAVRKGIAGEPFDSNRKWTVGEVDAMGGPSNTPLAFGRYEDDRAERAIMQLEKEIADWKSSPLSGPVPQHMIDRYNAYAKQLGYSPYSEGVAPGKSGTGGVDLRGSLDALGRIVGSAPPRNDKEVPR